MKRPVGGYGTGRAARIIGYWGRTLSVDNYYLSLAVDYGLPGPIIFLSLLFVTAHSSRQHAATAPPKMAAIYTSLAAALIAFAISRSIISQTGNLSFFYLVLGAFVGVNARLSSARARARINR